MIQGQILSFPAEAAPASFVGTSNNTAAGIAVMDQSGTTPLTSATVTVNGTALTYQSANQAYYGNLTISPGGGVSIVVTVNGVTYDASYTQFNTYPTITSPAPNSNWSSQGANLVSWTGIRPDSVSQYLLGVIGTDGSVVWPSNAIFQETTASSFTIPSGSLTPGARLVLVGVADEIGVSGGAPGSDIVYAGFNYQPINISNTTPTTVSLLSISPASSSVGVGRTVQLSAAAIMSDNTRQEVTAEATWQSSSAGTASVSNTGTVTGVASGTATVTASYQGVSTTANILVFQTTPSPVTPLSQAVAYQIDYAHSGFVTFGGSGPTFPPTSTWSVTLDSMIFYPLIANGSVFVATENDSTNALSLYALSETSGTTLWGPVTLPGGGLHWAGAAYDQGNVFAVSSGTVQGGVAIQAYNATTGALKWSSILQGSYDIASAPTAVNGVIYLNGNGFTYAIDEQTGNTLWSAQVETGGDGSPAVSADGVFVAFPCQAYKFDPLSGAALWHYSGPCDGGGGETPVYANGLLYIQNIVPLLGASSNLIFNAQTGVQEGSFTASVVPAVSSNAAFYLNKGTLTEFNLSAQTTLWTFQGDGQLTTAPIIIDGTVVIGSASGTVYALNAVTGAIVWSGRAGSTISSSPWTGLGAGEGWLVVPAGNVLSAWKLTQ
ncbi:MAG TPA: PQQ-binding-like beta-propeller repeat protein [Steroidobacteraceae bacterium]|nr:PQQ-binding-like beta-propeller repeat protein [Steroidobacteraceae bacterium]